MNMEIEAYLRCLSHSKDDMLHIQRSLSNYLSVLKVSWKGHDGKLMQEMVERLNRQSGKIQTEIDELQSSILVAQSEIEEEAAEQMKME